jgi:hypothetical protein
VMVLPESAGAEGRAREGFSPANEEKEDVT